MNIKNKNYHWVVTGGAGFIGSHLVRELVRQNQRVTVFDNFSTSSADSLADVTDKIQLVVGDVRDCAALHNALKGADYVLHHAALVSVPKSVESPEETSQINIQGTANVLAAARACGVRRVVYASSSAVYGNGTALPHKETDPVDCQSPYAVSKQAGGELCRLYTHLYGLETVSLRYFNVYGRGQNPRAAYAAVVAKFMGCAQENQPFEIDGDGLQSRDFIHVSDVVQANLLAALKGEAAGMYNVASGKTCSVLSLADKIEYISGRKLGRVFRPKRAGDVRHSSADISKISRLGFVPRVSLEDGLTDLWCQINETL